LEKKTNELISLIDNEINKLKIDGKDSLTTGFEETKKFLIKIESRLKSIDLDTKAGKQLIISFDSLLEKVEIQVKAEIEKLSNNV